MTHSPEETLVVYSFDIHESGREEPAWSGLFYAGDVARLLSVTDDQIRGDHLDLGPRVVQGWSRRGFFEMEKNEYARHRAFISFGGVITARVITLLRSYGTRIGRIKQAHDYLRDEMGRQFPFASRTFWVESDGFSDEVYTKLDEFVVSASQHGQRPFTELLHGRIRGTDDMKFGASGGAFATNWEPAPGIVIDPGVQSGAACLKGTRTPTYALYGGYVAGDDVSGMADAYRLSEEQVHAAIAWEERLAHV